MHSLTVSLLVFLLFGLLTTLVWFLREKSIQRRRMTIPLTNAERRLGWKNIRFIASRFYRNWRNPMRNLRRRFGWPSGRQWRHARKHFRAFYKTHNQLQEAFAV